MTAPGGRLRRDRQHQRRLGRLLRPVRRRAAQRHPHRGRPLPGARSRRRPGLRRPRVRTPAIRPECSPAASTSPTSTTPSSSKTPARSPAAPSFLIRLRPPETAFCIAPPELEEGAALAPSPRGDLCKTPPRARKRGGSFSLSLWRPLHNAPRICGRSNSHLEECNGVRCQFIQGDAGLYPLQGERQNLPRT